MKKKVLVRIKCVDTTAVNTSKVDKESSSVKEEKTPKIFILGDTAYRIGWVCAQGQEKNSSYCDQCSLVFMDNPAICCAMVYPKIVKEYLLSPADVQKANNPIYHYFSTHAEAQTALKTWLPGVPTDDLGVNPTKASDETLRNHFFKPDVPDNEIIQFIASINHNRLSDDAIQYLLDSVYSDKLFKL